MINYQNYIERIETCTDEIINSYLENFFDPSLKGKVKRGFYTVINQ